MDSFKNSENLIKRKSTTELFVDDFETQNWELSNKTKDSVSKYRFQFNALYTLDLIICHVFIGPAVVAFWRGTWDFANYWYDEVLFEKNHNLSNALALFIGLIANFSLDLFHSSVNKLAGKVGTWRHVVVRNSFSIVYGVLDILLWKGVWDGYDHWVGNGLYQSLATLITGLIVLSVFRTVKTAWSMPNGIVVDRAEDQISADTFWQTQPEDTILKRWRDCFLSRMLEIATIFVWHGVWSTTDNFSEEFLCQLDEYACRDSALLSLLIGWSGGLFLFMSQYPLVILASRRHNSRLSLIGFNIVNYIFNVAGVYFTINSFRAAWYLLDVYYFPEEKVLSWLSALSFGVIILFTFRCISCLHAGIYRDKAKCGVTIGYHLLSYFYVKSLDKKLRRDDTSVDNNNKTDTPDDVTKYDFQK